MCIALINETSRKVRARYGQASRGGAGLATSSIVVHELWYGVAKSALPDLNARRLQAFLERDLTMLEFSPQDARTAGEIRAELERIGKRIDGHETLIAGHAFSKNLILVTANTREFSRVRGLVVEDWSL